MSRFLYLSIYGGTFLLSGVLIAASVMAIFGFVPFRSAQPLRASPAGSESIVAALSNLPAHEVMRADEARRNDAGGPPYRAHGRM